MNCESKMNANPIPSTAATAEPLVAGDRVGKVLKRRIFFAVSTGWGYRVIGIASNFAVMYLLFRYLSEELLGIWFLMVGAQMFAGLFDLGFGQTFQRRIAFAKGGRISQLDIEDDGETRQSIRTILGLARSVYLFTSIVVGAGVFFAGCWYFASLELSPIARDSLRWTWLIMAVGYGANVWAGYVEAALNGIGDIGWGNIVQAISLALNVLATWIVLTSGGGLAALAVVWAIKGVSVRIMGWHIVVARHAWLRHNEEGFCWNDFREVLKPALRWWLAVVGYFLTTGITRYLLAGLGGVEKVPDYVATYMVLVTLQGTMVSVVTVGTPLFSQLIAAGDLARVRVAILRLMQLSLVGLALLYALVGTFAQELFEMWLGKGHFVGYPVFLTLAAGMMIEGHQGMIQSAVIAGERLSWFKYNLIGGVMSVLLAIWWIPRWGVLGAAMAVVASQALTQNWIVPYVAVNFLQLRFSSLANQVILPAALAGTLVVGVGILSKSLMSHFLVCFAVTTLAAIALAATMGGRRALVEMRSLLGVTAVKQGGNHE